MESNMEEALRAKAIAENHFAQRDFVGAKNYGLKAQMLCPELEGLSQMVATFGVHIAAEGKINGQLDFYSILGLDASANKSKLKKQYKKMAVLLHPDKNKCVGAEGAFKLVSEAWTLLSDSHTRRAYDHRRNFFSGKSSSRGAYKNCSKFPPSHGTVDSFWTVCTSCHVQYEYLRKYVNKRLSCKNCRCVFIAVETGLAPVDGSFPYCSYPRGSENGYGSHNYGVSFAPSTSGYCTPNGVLGHHTGHISEYVSNISFQGDSSGNSAVNLDPNGFSASSFHFYQSNGEAKKTKESGKHRMVNTAGHVSSNGFTVRDGLLIPKHGRPSKKRKLDSEITFGNGHKETYPIIASDAKIANGNGSLKATSEFTSSGETSNRRSLTTGFVGSNLFTVHDGLLKPKRGRPSKKRKLDSEVTFGNGHKEINRIIASDAKIAYGNGSLRATPKFNSSGEILNWHSLTSPGLDVRQFLIDKARTEIRRKLEENRIAAEVEKKNMHAEADKSIELTNVPCLTVASHRPDVKRNVSMSITVPDSDFHDFDQDRSEECFKTKQIWALYDEEDGMPRLYCLIREVLSVKPFKSYISYLSSKYDSEFGSVNWLDSGFTKSCGSFRVFSSEMVEQVNIFSHLLRREKAGRGGCVRIYPRSGDIWAIYHNWSPDWNRNTPDIVRHQYEMVEVFDDYSEEHGIWVTPLIKLDGFKTVYRRNSDSDAIRYIPRKEMLRFSHQVPSCSLEADRTGLPEGCWDLDPAAIPDKLLQEDTDLLNKPSPSGMEKTIETESGKFSSSAEKDIGRNTCMHEIAPGHLSNPIIQ